MNYGSASFLLSTFLIILLFQVLSFWQVFSKAGFDGWKSIIPIYNTYILIKIGSQPIWVFIMLFIPVLNFLASILIALSVAKSFGKGPAFGIVGLFIFSFFGYMYLGWGDSEYNKIEVTEQ
jgi:hypothetical protein